MAYSLEILLPWPDAKLSPNARQHWRTHYRAKKAYLQTCRLLVLSTRPRRVPKDSPLLVHLQFAPPSRHRHDADNLVARMKSGLDGLAQALQVDDHRFRLAAPSIVEPVREGHVRVRVEEVATDTTNP